MPTCRQARKHIFFGLEYEKSINQVPQISDFEKYLKDAHKKSVQNGPDTFANELTRFPFEAKPIWKNNQQLCKNTVIFKIWLHLFQILKKTGKMLTTNLCRMAVALLQMSSWGSILKRNRFGIEFKTE